MHARLWRSCETESSCESDSATPGILIKPADGLQTRAKKSRSSGDKAIEISNVTGGNVVAISGDISGAGVNISFGEPVEANSNHDKDTSQREATVQEIPVSSEPRAQEDAGESDVTSSVPVVEHVTIDISCDNVSSSDRFILSNGCDVLQAMRSFISTSNKNQSGLEVLRSGGIFPFESDPLEQILETGEIEELRKMFPVLPPPDTALKDIMQGRKTVGAQDSVGPLEIFANYMSFTCRSLLPHYQDICHRSGEGVTDGLWTAILDSAVLPTGLFFLDRKEITSNAYTARRYDGVFRLRRLFDLTGDQAIDIGLVEIKPPRHHQSKESLRVDYLKVVFGLQKLLVHLVKHFNIPEAKEMVLIGILCHGFRITFIQSRYVSANLFMHKKRDFILSEDTLTLITECIWQAVKALVSTYHIIKQAVEVSRQELL